MPTQSQLFLHTFRNSWKYILATILILPILKWLFLVPIDARFGSFAASAKALGQVTGIVGTLLFSFSLILSFRNRVTETIFGGLDTLYRVHHQSGMYGLFLLLLHPLLLSVPRLMYSVEDAASFLTPFQTSTAVDFGIFSVIAFMVLIGVTLFGVIFSYQALKRFHQFLGVAFLLGAVHGFMIPSDIQNDVFIRVWVLGFVCAGLFSYVVYSLGKRFTIPKKLFKVSSVAKIQSGITEIVLTPVSEGVNHLPGQFAFFSCIDSKSVPNNEAHPFTISSWETNGSVSISAKGLGDFTSLLPGVEVGSYVNVEGPFGEFVYGFWGKDQVWVAGGVGVTPFVSFAKHILTQKDFSHNIEFYYSVRTNDDLAFHELFMSVANLHPTFKYHPMPSDTSGYITGDLLVHTVPGIITRDIVMCGPPPMMNALTGSLVTFGINRKHIHSELFSLLK